MPLADVTCLLYELTANMYTQYVDYSRRKKKNPANVPMRYGPSQRGHSMLIEGTCTFGNKYNFFLSFEGSSSEIEKQNIMKVEAESL